MQTIEPTGPTGPAKRLSSPSTASSLNLLQMIFQLPQPAHVSGGFFGERDADGSGGSKVWMPTS